MTIVTIGIDLAKNVFAVHGVDAQGRALLIQPQVKRDKLLALIAGLPPCLIGMEACCGAHHWARAFERFGHTVRLMAPQFVTPYRKNVRIKNDAADAAAICEAVARPNMRFVPIKTVEQQGQLFVHRARQGYIEQRTALINRIRGLLGELGHIVPLSRAQFCKTVHAVIEDLPGHCNIVIGDLLSELAQIEQRLAHYDRLLAQIARDDAQVQRLMQVPGIGPTTATALVASIGRGQEFKNGRQLSAWLGLVPRQHSSGGKARLGGITKAGDRYLRVLLVLGARAMLRCAKNRDDPISRWALALQERRGYGRAVVAIAAKNARLCWAALQMQERFKLPA